MRREIYLAGGCFWGMEQYFAHISGVVETQVGYANGKTANPTYAQVCHENTGHAETVKVVYDDAVVGLPFLLSMYYEVINPTAINRQGGDHGTQYRTGIYYVDEAERPPILASVGALQARYDQPIAIQVLPLENYCKAEEAHQKYLDKNRGGYCHIGPEHFEKAKTAKDTAGRYQAKSQEELAQSLSALQYRVTQTGATEPPFQNEYFAQFQEGIYVDITTGEPLFASTDKFESGCGWPSFSRPIRKEAVTEYTDQSHGMSRTEVKSKTGGAHLGHVFTDGPADRGGLRYCINSASLRFIPKADMEKAGYGAVLPLL